MNAFASLFVKPKSQEAKKPKAEKQNTPPLFWGALDVFGSAHQALMKLSNAFFLRLLGDMWIFTRTATILRPTSCCLCG